MLDLFFQKPASLRAMRRGPLAAHLDAFADDLHRKGYAWNTARSILWIGGLFNGYVRVSGMAVARIDEAFVDRFFREELAARGEFSHGPIAMTHVLGYLRARNAIPAAPPPQPREDRFAAVLQRFDGHLRDVRGLTEPTREGYGRWARRFLEFHEMRTRGASLASLKGDHVLAYVTEVAEQYDTRPWKNTLCSTTRIFLRFLHWDGIVASDLQWVVPRTTRYRLDSVPKHLPWQDVERLIDMVDVSQGDGKRDRAVLLLLARCGLRAHDVRVLEIDNISWRKRELRLPVTKTRRERVLPLPREVFEALADSLLHGRPALDGRRVFVRHRAPHGPITSSGGISGIVRKYLKKAGIHSPRRGAHLLRHSLATRMVNSGLPIKAIADVLGHDSMGASISVHIVA